LDPVGSTVSPEQVRSELVRQFPRAVGSGRLSVGLAAAASAAPQLPADAGATALVIDPDGEDALGWAVANWAVARAADDGVVQVSYQGRVWDRSVRGEEASRWGEASGGTADHVVVLVSGRRPAPRPSADRGSARREASAALLDRGLQLGQTQLAGAGALAHLLVGALGVAGVDLARAADLRLRVVDHLLPLGDPARQAADGEQHREHLGGEADGLVDQTGVEVDVRVELALDEVVVLQRDLLELPGELEARVVDAEPFEHVVGDLLDEPGARIVVLVHPVAEAHQADAVLLALDLLH